MIFGNNLQARTIVQELTEWRFFKGDPSAAAQANFNDASWTKVKIPHDWAIYGPFDKEIDKQVVKIEQNNEQKAEEKTGRTGALPFIGVGWYRTKLTLPKEANNKQILLTFDGAMSNAEVFVNGKKVGSRPYGYSYFYFDITKFLTANTNNQIAVRLENLPQSSRWYPGAGLYRKVQVIIKNKISFKHWGHFVTTPFVSDSLAKINICSTIQGQSFNDDIHLITNIKNTDGLIVSSITANQFFSNEIEQNIAVTEPALWSPETPNLYTAEIMLYAGKQLKDTASIRFGIRSIQYSPQEGFQLNGEPLKFKGVCLHHDLGPIGAAVNKAALKRQLTILKEMGCNAVRSTHNMPSLEQLDLCDEMGILFLAESFDEWKKPKVKNGYNLYFDEWVEKDIVNLVQATRNHPCIVMWSAGNEVPDQWGSNGVKRLKYIQDIFHREDPTRPVTVGMNQVEATMESGFGAILDIPGLNYSLPLYEDAYDKFPQGLLLGSETASTVSSRGIYKFPVAKGANKIYPDLQCSSYDVEYCNWSNVPDDDFVWQDNKPWVIGEFVWTGFDYLGEPTPYDSYWPSRSSYFGICDLAGLPKDRYYLYRSRWNTQAPTLHILPHWNWPERVGKTTPVYVYTNYPSAELFVNGVSKGIQTKSNASTNLHRYRLMWPNVQYEPGRLKVIAYDNNGLVIAEKTVVTANKAYTVKLEADRQTINANSKDISFITVTVVDKNRNYCPTATNLLNFEVQGAGKFRAACNGDATSITMFHKPQMQAFSGKLVVLVQSLKVAGDIVLHVSGKDIKAQAIKIKAQKK